MRGKLPLLTAARYFLRITPAGAGKTRSARWHCRVHRDHPRRCGENASVFFSGRMISGSPPQVRGKPATPNRADKVRRITPAGAGKTRRCCAHRPKSQDHPRRCGENKMSRECRLSDLGSPPQVRGKPADVSQFSIYDGITPAGAGKTLLRRRCKHHTRDHPRRCGENRYKGLSHQAHLGSPPQVRGKPSYGIYNSLKRRITPAGAGKTFALSLLLSATKDHPRRCGENIQPTPPKHDITGSPPQVRGKLVVPADISTKSRITPAGAGKTTTKSP